MEVNGKIINSMKLYKEAFKLQNERAIEDYKRAKSEGASQEYLDELRDRAQKSLDSYNEIGADYIEYKQKIDQIIKEQRKANPDQDRIKQYKNALKEFEGELSGKYLGETKKKNNTGKKIIKAVAIIGALALAGLGIGKWVVPAIKNHAETRQEQQAEDKNTTENADKSADKADPKKDEEKDLSKLELGEPGTFTDATDKEAVEARANWYYKTYFEKEFEKLSVVGKESATKEGIIDGILVANGEYPIYDKDFTTNDILNHNNALVQSFCSYLKLDNKSGKVGFVPSQYLFEDGSYEQKCVAQVDAIMEPLVKAINEKDHESFKKYAKKFGELMRDQYLNLDFTDENYNVRGRADFASKIHMYSLAYAEFTNKIMTYQIEHGIDVCIPVCVDHNTKETVEYPLSKLMATLEFVPIVEWDAVLQRSGYTVKDLEKLGNKSTEDTMPVIFTSDAKNHFREKEFSLSLK